MKKMITAAAVAASVAIGGVAGVALGVPTLASAQETADETVTWIDEALSGLVSDGTINQAQADAVESALEEAKPDRPHRGHRPGHRIARHFAMDALAEALGMSNSELREALSEDKSLADIAGERGVEVQTAIDALVAQHKAHLDEHVAAGDLTQEKADARLAKFTERVTALVNGDAPRLRALVS